MSHTDIAPDKHVSRSKVKKPHPQLISWTEHDPRSSSHRAELAKRMRKDGWCGFPLLTHECGDGSYQAWMGMHRLLAADDANLLAIPIVVMKRRELRKIGFTDFEIDNDPWTKWDRLASLEDLRPRQLMVAEGENQPKRGF